MKNEDRQTQQPNENKFSGFWQRQLNSLKSKLNLKNTLFYTAFFIFIFIMVYRQNAGLLESGQSLPSVELPLLKQQGQLASLTGKEGGLVYIFAPWCGVCKLSASNINSLAESFPERRVTALALGYKSVEDVKQFVAENDLNVPVLMGNDALSSRLGVSAFPTTYYFDDQGRVTWTTVGYTTTAGHYVRMLLFN